ncbi:MAG: hypothetical protein HHAS10_00940 [Candidatus Altimarinota bacterium]
MNWVTWILVICLLVSGCNGEGSTEKPSPVESASATTRDVPLGSCPKDALTLVSWNVMNFGSKKTDETIKRMSDILLSRGLIYRNQEKIRANIILLQEVNAGSRTGGVQTVARLGSALGQDWDSVTSDSTSGDGVERYAILWEKSAFEVNRRDAYLVQDLRDAIDREPFGLRLTRGGQSFWVYSYHAVPTAKKPIREIKVVRGSAELESRSAAILAGDFNLGRTSVVDIFAGWTDHIDGKTSLKSTIGKDGSYLSYQYDHILTKGGVRVCESGIIDFVSLHFSPVDVENLRRAREISDHLPVYIRFTLKPEGN